MLAPRRRQRDSRCPAPRNIPEEDVARAVCVTGHEIARGGREHDISAVGRPVEAFAPPIVGLAGCRDRDPDDGASCQVRAEDPGHPGAISRHQVGRVGLQGDIPSVIGHHRQRTGPIGLGACDCLGDQTGGAGDPVPDEDVWIFPVSFGARFVAVEAKTTNRPVADISGWLELPFPSAGGVAPVGEATARAALADRAAIAQERMLRMGRA